MEWDREKCLHLIDEYEKSAELWNPQHGLYYNKLKKVEAWANIDEIMGCPPGEAKKKMDSILGSFRREKAKGKKFVGAGKGRQEIYVSQWYAFTRMAFLLDRDEPKPTLNPVKEEIYLDEPEGVPEDAPGTKNAVTSQPATAVNSESETEFPQTTLARTCVRSCAPLQKYKRKKLLAETDSQVGKALDILRRVAASSNLKNDECSVYAQHVAHKLRSYSKRTQNIVEHHINLILFNADMGQYDHMEPSQSALLPSSAGFNALAADHQLAADMAPIALPSSRAEQQSAVSIVNGSHETC